MNKYLNCGCGNKYVIADEWINVDFNSRNKDVLPVNLLGRLPFQDESFDAVFNSCMLEHFTKNEGERFIEECYRVLKPGGILRVVVPDLENICEEYLKVLHECKEREKDSKRKYDYIVIELIDQMTRSRPGGEMLKYWNLKDKDEEYILERTGYPEATEESKEVSIIGKLKNAHYHIDMILEKMFGKLLVFKRYFLGKFMLSGEVHKWMYDSYSLGRLFREKRFSDIKVLKYNESQIKDWAKYGLEINANGEEYKPNCLYMEAIK